MKNKFYLLAGALIMLTSATFMIEPAKYTVKDGYSLDFKSKDPSGSFTDLEGTVHFDKEDLANSKLEFTVKVSSINTGNTMKDKKAQTSEWFDAAKYPNIKYKSTKIGEYKGVYYVYGDLTIKGVTKEYKVPMNVEVKENGMVLTGSFTVKRSDFKVGKPSQTVPDGMRVTYSIPVAKS